MGPQSGSLYVYAGVDVDVAIDGNPPSRMDTTVPILEFVFEGLAAGEHPVLISDVIGHSESALVMIVEALPDEQEAPDWLAKWVAGLEAGAVEFRLGPSPDTNTKARPSTTCLRKAATSSATFWTPTATSSVIRTAVSLAEVTDSPSSRRKILMAKRTAWDASRR